MKPFLKSRSTQVWVVAIAILLGIIGFGSYRYYKLNKEFKSSQEEFASTTTALRGNIETLNISLSKAESVNADLLAKLTGEKNQNDIYGQQIESISSTVGELYKLSKTDRELLQKYSNVYFLNENYVPSALSSIETSFLNRSEKSESIHTSVKPFLENLLRAAQADSVPLQILSAYRSFGTQATLKANYKTVFGTTAANRFSADQGYSEHQLGSAVDFTTPKGGETLQGFEKTASYAWLTEHAYTYGFVLSYPKNNKFYQFEPWHWRYVGVELATKLHNENKYFYDLDQREINEYLVKIFN